MGRATVQALKLNHSALSASAWSKKHLECIHRVG